MCLAIPLDVDPRQEATLVPFVEMKLTPGYADFR